jgi:hypothetical protein
MPSVTIEPHHFGTGDFALVSEDYPYFSDHGISLFRLTLGLVVVFIHHPTITTGHVAGELYCVIRFQAAVLT